jgi:hypothetical protein
MMVSNIPLFGIVDECFEVKVLFPKDLEIKQVVSQTYLYISPSSYHPQRAANFYIGGFLTYHNHFLVSALRGLARLGRDFLWRPSREGGGVEEQASQT